MKRILVLILMTISLTTFGIALAAADNSAGGNFFVVGEWFLGDNFTQTAGNGVTPDAVKTADTQFTFLNPTDHNQFNEYAFFDQDGKFCGCDRDEKVPNAIIRYTMQGELAGGQFSCQAKGKPTSTQGTMKSIAFSLNKKGSIDFSTSVNAGHQVHFGVGLGTGNTNNTESDLIPVPITKSTMNDAISIHNQCVNALGPVAEMIK